MRRQNETKDELKPLDAGYERQCAVERQMAKAKHESLVNPQGYVRYASTETQPLDDDIEDLQMFRRNDRQVSGSTRVRS